MSEQTRAARFEALVAPCERRLYFTCLNLIGKREDAEDCAQEALLKAYKGFDRFRAEAQFSTWLYTIAVRCCLDALRRNQKNSVSLDGLIDAGWQKEDEAPGLYEQLETKERQELIRFALSQLPPDHRAALVLVELNGFSLKEASGMLECPEGTVKSRLHRGKQSLEKIISEKMELNSRAERLIK